MRSVSCTTWFDPDVPMYCNRLSSTQITHTVSTLLVMLLISAFHASNASVEPINTSFYIKTTATKHADTCEVLKSCTNQSSCTLGVDHKRLLALNESCVTEAGSIMAGIINVNVPCKCEHYCNYQAIPSNLDEYSM